MRVHITTLGCPKNVVDSEMMVELLRQAGHTVVGDAGSADVLIVNTCGFIEAAREESYRTLTELATAKGEQQWLVAAGCLAQRQGRAIRRRVPQIDAVIGTSASVFSGNTFRVVRPPSPVCCFTVSREIAAPRCPPATITSEYAGNASCRPPTTIQTPTR